MFKWILPLLFLVSLTGCATVKNSTSAEATSTLVAPIVFTQDTGYRNTYTHEVPFVVCYGLNCDQPTTKHPVSQVVASTGLQVQATPIMTTPRTQAEVPSVETQALPTKKSDESVQYTFNTVHTTHLGNARLKQVIALGKRAKEITVRGYAGLTDSNLVHEKGVEDLAKKRAQDIHARLIKAGVTAYIQTQSRIVHCKSESDCLKKYPYGGRRADVEIRTPEKEDQ